jgi:hypothetical protein
VKDLQYSILTSFEINIASLIAFSIKMPKSRELNSQKVIFVCSLLQESV